MNVTDLDEHVGQHIGGSSTDLAFTLAGRPVPTTYDNNVRAGLAVTALKAFSERAGEQDVETTITDLLANLMHLCDSLDLTFDRLVSRAHRHHSPEVRGF